MGDPEGMWSTIDQNVAMQDLTPKILPGELQFSFEPVSGNMFALSEARNLFNYKTNQSAKMIQDFAASYDKQTFPTCLPGKLGTMWRIAEALLMANASLIKSLGLKTDVPQNLFGTSVSNLSSAIREINRSPEGGLISKSKSGVIMSLVK